MIRMMIKMNSNRESYNMLYQERSSCQLNKPGNDEDQLMAGHSNYNSQIWR